MSSGRPVFFHELTWPRLAKLVEEGERLCLLPVGAVEQHGRHLPTNTDAAIAEALCRAVSATTAVPVLPTLWLTSSQAHTKKWPGTLAITPRALIETVVQLADWVRASGFDKLLIVNAHGGNEAPLRVAVDEIRLRGDMQVGMITWFNVTPEIRGRFTSDGQDVHGNKAETALMMHLHPDLIDASAVVDDPDRTVGNVFSYTVPQTSREGLTGSPSQATASFGSELFEAVVAALTELVEAARREVPPI